MIMMASIGMANDGPLLLEHKEGGMTGGQHGAWPGQIRVRRQGLESRTRQDDLCSPGLGDWCGRW